MIFLVEGTTHRRLFRVAQDTLRPVEKYAVRFLEETGPPFDIAAAAAAAAQEGRQDWDLEQLQALQAQQVTRFSQQMMMRLPWAAEL